jgi:hypothetical protein
MPHAPDLYRDLKGRAYDAATVTVGGGNIHVYAAGYADVFDKIMSNGDHSRQAVFVWLPSNSRRPVAMFSSMVWRG